jgi:polar amino acid transport system permease protein/arginine/ornithine transport system permease protein
MLDLRGYGPLLLEGLQVTLAVALTSLPGAVLWGGVLAAVKLSGGRFLPRAVNVYVNVIRGIPELVLLLLVYYAVPSLVQDMVSRLSGREVIVNLDPFLAGTGTLVAIYGAFASEVFRAAYLGLPAGQREASAALGLSRLIALRFVILPQLLRLALPGLGNLWMVLIKATALISVIQLPELMRNADIASRATRLPFTFFTAACAIYLVITLASMWAQARAETWAERGLVRAAQ